MQILQGSDSEHDRRWDAYVGARTSSVLDLSAWRHIVRDVYGMESLALLAFEEDRPVGALGLFEVRHPLFGHYLATAPFGNDGGLFFENDEARDALLAEAKRIADRLDVAYMVIRTRDGDLPGFEVDRRYQSAVLDLEPGSETIWKERLPGKTRNQVRRGMKENFAISSGPDQRGAFFDVFHEHMRDLGSPAHGRRYYESIVEHLGDRAEFVVVRDGSALAAGALVFRIHGTATNYHTVALRRYNRRCPNYFIYWSMIESSCALGCRRFDMGRSEAGSSNLKFKLNWGADAVSLQYNYYLRRMERIPYLHHRNLRYRLPIAAWKKLPVFLTKQLGPRLIPGLV
jgi:FemAB-related protein (PEP-CTERM system-associated)